MNSNMNSKPMHVEVDLIELSQNFNNGVPLAWSVPADKMTDPEMLLFFAKQGLGKIASQSLVSFDEQIKEKKPWKVEPFLENTIEAIALLTGARALAAVPHAPQEHVSQKHNIDADLASPRKPAKPPRINTNIQFPETAFIDIPEIGEHISACASLYIQARFVRFDEPNVVFSITDEYSLNGESPLLDILGRHNVPFDVRHANYDSGERWKRHLRFAPDGTRIDYTHRMSDNPHFDPSTLVENIREVAQYWRPGIEQEAVAKAQILPMRQRA